MNWYIPALVGLAVALIAVGIGGVGRLSTRLRNKDTFVLDIILSAVVTGLISGVIYVLGMGLTGLWWLFLGMAISGLGVGIARVLKERFL